MSFILNRKNKKHMIEIDCKVEKDERTIKDEKMAACTNGDREIERQRERERKCVYVCVGLLTPDSSFLVTTLQAT